MIIIEQKLKVEYETEASRSVHIEEMKEKGYIVDQISSGVDVYARNHIYAEYSKKQRGYMGESIFK